MRAVGARYAGAVSQAARLRRASETPLPPGVRDPLAAPEKVLAARRRPMSERLEVALSWNAMAAELRAGLAEARARQDPPDR